MKNHSPLMGAVYFRKTAPPKSDWEQDYRQAQLDGHKLFRHWFCWNAIEVAPGVYNWDDYDAQLELGRRYGIQTVIAEMSVDTPEWLNHQLGEAAVVMANGERRSSEMHTSSATGGHYCLCYDHPQVESYTNGFLAALARRYREHPALYGYDVFNECTLYSPERWCRCAATTQKFVAWLKRKYGSLQTLAAAWGRYSLTDWSQVQLPQQMTPYTESVDAIQFWNENTYDNMAKKVAVLRQQDTTHRIVAHGNARSFNDIATCSGDDFRGSALCDVFGYTYYYGTACDPFLAGDLIRSAANQKEFWRAEAVGNSDYQARNATQPPQTAKDRAADPAYLRLDALISVACGARAYMSPRWRPLLAGPLAGAFGWYGLDGSPTPRSQEMQGLADWFDSEGAQGVWRAEPVASDGAILLLEEAQICSYLFGRYQHYADYYCHEYGCCVQGAHAALLDSGIQCDLIKLDGIDRYKTLYVPYPLAMSEQTIARLTTWVEAGGRLIIEGGAGYFDDSLKLRMVMRHQGLRRLLGCIPQEMALAPDCYNQYEVHWSGGKWFGGICGQALQEPQGSPIAWDQAGRAQAFGHELGRGRVLTLGTMPSYGYYTHEDSDTAEFIAWLWQAEKPNNLWAQAGKQVVMRLWESETDGYIWLINRSNTAQCARMMYGSIQLTITKAMLVRGDASVISAEGHVVLPPMDAVVVQMKKVIGL